MTKPIPTERSLELAEIALDNAAGACGNGFGHGTSDLADLANEYRLAETQIAALRGHLYPSGTTPGALAEPVTTESITLGLTPTHEGEGLAPVLRRLTGLAFKVTIFDLRRAAFDAELQNVLDSDRTYDEPVAVFAEWDEAGQDFSGPQTRLPLSIIGRLDYL